MPLTYDQLVLLHKKATQNLERKLARIPARIFPSGRKPTITDIYEHPDSLIKPTIHPNLQLIYIFEHYNKFAASGFRARKKEQEMSVTLAIFQWNMDQQHSFSCYHKEVRFNVLLAHMTLEAPNARAQMEPELHRFLDTFIRAWLETAVRTDHGQCQYKDYWVAKCWKTGKYDLVRWGPRARDRMSTAVKALEAHVPPPHVNVEDFWAKASSMPQEEYNKHGHAWAMQYIIYKEKEGKSKDIEEKHANVEDSLNTGAFFSGFDNLGMGDTVPTYLSEELFSRPLVQALLTDINEGMGVQAPEVTVPWMDPSKAISLMEGEVEGLEDITEQFKAMSFLRGPE